MNQAGPKSSGWSAFQHGISQLRQIPNQVVHGLQTATRLPVVAAMKARAAAHDLNVHWQGAARNSLRAAPPQHGRQSAPGPAVADSKLSRFAAKQQFFAQNQPQLRSGQYWARQDTSGQWQMVAHDSNTLHHLLKAGGGLVRRTQENAYNLVTLPEQLGEFAASPAGEDFRAAPEDLLIGLATNALQQAKRLAVDIPSGKAEDDFIKPFREGNDEQKGAFVADVGLEVASLVPWGKIATGAKMLAGVARAGRQSNAVRGMDFMSKVGSRGGKIYDPQKLEQLKGYFERRGITLEVGDQFVPVGKSGGFDGTHRKMVLRSEPTEYEVWHEVGHYRDYQKKGAKIYNDPEVHPSVAREQVVFDMLQNSSKRWNALTLEEQEHAIWYIQYVGGIR